MPFAMRDIKTLLAGAIQQAIDQISKDCAAAEPGVLYLSGDIAQPTIPTDTAIGSLLKHTASERGTLPIFTAGETDSAFARTPHK